MDNAGIAPPVRADLLEVAEADWDRVLDVNLTGTFFLTQRVAREMIARRTPETTPRIVVVTSISADTASTARGADTTMVTTNSETPPEVSKYTTAV